MCYIHRDALAIHKAGFGSSAHGMLETAALIRLHLSPLCQTASIREEAEMLHGMSHDLPTFALHVTSSYELSLKASWEH